MRTRLPKLICLVAAVVVLVGCAAPAHQAGVSDPKGKWNFSLSPEYQVSPDAPPRSAEGSDGHDVVHFSVVPTPAASSVSVSPQKMSVNIHTFGSDEERAAAVAKLDNPKTLTACGGRLLEVDGIPNMFGAGVSIISPRGRYALEFSLDDDRVDAKLPEICSVIASFAKSTGQVP